MEKKREIERTTLRQYQIWPFGAKSHWRNRPSSQNMARLPPLQGDAKCLFIYSYIYNLNFKAECMWASNGFCS